MKNIFIFQQKGKKQTILNIYSIPFSLITYTAHCGRSNNEQLGAKAHTACYVAEGEVGGPTEIPPDLPACVSLSKCRESGQKG